MTCSWTTGLCSSLVCTVTCDYLMPMLGGMLGTRSVTQ
eukprot:COSAG01_NODE_3717_length_5767_cov_157.763585_6_plen_38_part_00